MKLNTIICIVVGLLFTTQAEAKRSKRQGFNFGTTVRLLSNYQNIASQDATQPKNETESSGTSVSPYIGYSIGGVFNIGLKTTVESADATYTLSKNNGKTSIEVEDNANLRSASMYMRFLFGGILYMEGSGGFYQKQLESNEKSTSFSSGSFQGESVTSRLEGIGTGYTVGAGVEVPVASGFFLTGGYETRMFRINDFSGESSDGKKLKKSIYEQSKELVFGVSHYMN